METPICSDRADIVRVGQAPDPDIGPVGWAFDCKGVVPPQAIDQDDQRRWGGYSLSDLWDAWEYVNRN